MKTKKVTLILYIIACVFTVVATMLDDEVMIILSKPVVIPAIFFYYLSEKKLRPVDGLFIILLVLNFIGDTIALMKIENETMYIMVPFFLSYLILLKFTIDDARAISFNLKGIFVSLIVGSFLMYIMYSLIELIIDTNPELIVPVIIYGIILGSFVSIAVYCFYTKNSISTYYLLMAALMSVVSDVFYIVFSLILHFPGFSYFELTVQLFSYFFIVKYFVSRKI